MRCFLYALCFIACSLVSTTTLAVTERERQELARIVSELEYLQHEVKQVSRLRRVDDPEAFSYEDLVDDIETVKKAVERHIKGPSRQPRPIEPLKAESNGYIH